jgi:hypothetical protein
MHPRNCAGGPPMIATISGNPRVSARTDDCGVLPAPAPPRQRGPMVPRPMLVRLSTQREPRVELFGERRGVQAPKSRRAHQQKPRRVLQAAIPPLDKLARLAGARLVAAGAGARESRRAPSCAARGDERGNGRCWPAATSLHATHFLLDAGGQPGRSAYAPLVPAGDSPENTAWPNRSICLRLWGRQTIPWSCCGSSRRERPPPGVSRATRPNSTVVTRSAAEPSSRRFAPYFVLPFFAG